MTQSCSGKIWNLGRRILVWVIGAFLVSAIGLWIGAAPEAAGGKSISKQSQGSGAASDVEREIAQDDPLSKEIEAVATQAGGDLYALIVGVSKYRNKQIPPLTVAAKDAQDFAAFLDSQKDLFKKTRVTLLQNEQATKAEVEKYLFYELRKAGKKDTIFVFMSGHGAIDPKRPGQFYFLTHEADPEVLEITALNMSGLSFLKNLDCPRVVLVADACHAGGFSKWRTKAAVVPMRNFVNDFSSSSGRVIITSSRPEEYSLEMPRLRNSLFTHFFLEGLKGTADRDGDGVVTVNEAYAYVYDRTKHESEGAQHPQFEGAVEGVFPISMSLNVESKPATFLEIFVDQPGADVFVGGRLVGKTNADGSMYLKYLPVGRPVPVKVKKEGWLEKSLGPFVFSKSKLHVSSKPVKLRPALASLELRTSPARVDVKIDGKAFGRTDGRGRIILHGVQVAVPHTVELEKGGYERESVLVTVPADSTGKRYSYDQVKLAKINAPAAQRSRDGDHMERGSYRTPVQREPRRRPTGRSDSGGFSPSGGFDAGSDERTGL